MNLGTGRSQGGPALRASMFISRSRAAAARRERNYLTDLPDLPCLCISPGLGNLVALPYIACLQQRRKVCLSPRPLSLAISLGPRKHEAAQAPPSRALNCGVGALVSCRSLKNYPGNQTYNPTLSNRPGTSSNPLSRANS
jgi:hypothetical protein